MAGVVGGCGCVLLGTIGGVGVPQLPLASGCEPSGHVVVCCCDDGGRTFLGGGGGEGGCSADGGIVVGGLGANATRNC